MNNKNNKGFTLIEFIILIAIIGVLAAMAMPNHSRRGSAGARRKACASNIRVISGAVEMYNMDSKESMIYLDLNKLVEGKYLKTMPSSPETGCKYYSIGDISQLDDMHEDEKGLIFCEFHGDLDNFKIKPGMTFNDYKYEKKRIKEEKEREEFQKKVMGQMIALLVVGLIIFFITLSSPKKKTKRSWVDCQEISFYENALYK